MSVRDWLSGPERPTGAAGAAQAAAGAAAFAGATWLHGVARRFTGDRRGATAVQAIVLMPLVIFFIAASVVMWQTVNIRKSFNNGVYEATRFLSLYPPADINTYTWEQVARKMVEAELLNNPWVKEPVSEADLRLTVRLNESNDCGDEFEVEARYRLFGPVGASGGSSAIGGMLPAMAPIELLEERQGVVICD